MLRIYIRHTCTSSIKALQWFKQHNIESEIKRVERITRGELQYILSQTDEGLFTIIKNPLRLQAELMGKLKTLESLSFSQAVNFILDSPELLRTPIIISKNKILIGYNDEQIRQFLSKEYRISSRKYFKKEQSND